MKMPIIYQVILIKFVEHILETKRKGGGVRVRNIYVR